jgi:hypothetical protein
MLARGSYKDDGSVPESWITPAIGRGITRNTLRNLGVGHHFDRLQALIFINIFTKLL